MQVQRVVSERSSREALPVSIQQEHLLLSREFFKRRNIKLMPNTIPCVLHLSGIVNHRLVEMALNEIVRRHQPLRTRFIPSRATSDQRDAELRQFGSSGVFLPGLYSQIVFEEAPLTLHLINLTGVPAAERDAYTTQQVQEAMRRSEDDAVPLLRATLLRGTTDHLLILSVNHLATDAWSMRIIRREFALVYCRLLGETQTSLAEPGFNGVAYAVRQRAMIADGDFESSLAFWRSQWQMFGSSRIGFDDFNFSLPKSEAPAYAFGSEEAQIDSRLRGRIRLIVRRVPTTLYVFFLAAFARVLRRCINRDKLALWAHFSNRLVPEFRDAVGWFATSHLIGIDMESDPDTRELLRIIGKTILDASEHQEMPVAFLWRKMGAYPNHPDARVLLDYADVGSHPAACGKHGLTIRHAPELNPVFGRFSGLGVYLRDYGDRIDCSVQYSLDRFPCGAIRALLANFRDEIDAMLDQLKPW